MNKDSKFTRVRIRLKLIPILQSFNPKIIETLAKTADLLKNEAESSVDNNAQIPEYLSIGELKNQSKILRTRRLRDWLKAKRGHLRLIESVHLEAIEKLIFSTKSGRIVELPNDEKVIKNQGKLSFEIKKVEKRRRAN